MSASSRKRPTAPGREAPRRPSQTQNGPDLADNLAEVNAAAANRQPRQRRAVQRQPQEIDNHRNYSNETVDHQYRLGSAGSRKFSVGKKMNSETAKEAANSRRRPRTLSRCQSQTCAGSSGKSVVYWYSQIAWYAR